MATTNGVARRLARLENVVDRRIPDPEQAAYWAERDRQRAEERDRLLTALAATMDVPRFIELTTPAATLDGRPIPEEHVRHLWQELELLCQQQGTGYLHQRFALHPAVVEALLRHGPAAWLQDGGCGGCRLPMPYRLHLKGEGFGMASGERVFSRCPDCGSDDLRTMHGRVPRPLDGPR